MKKYFIAILLICFLCASAWANPYVLNPNNGASNTSITQVIAASSGSLSSAQCSGGQIDNYDQTDDATITLPAAFSGMNFNVILGTAVAKYYRLDPDAGDSIYLDGVSCADGKYVGIAAAVVGASMSCRAFQTGASAYDIYCSAISGAWLCE